MKVKALLKFYFCAESLQKTLDALTLKRACRIGADAEDTFDCVCRIIEHKRALGELWSYLDAIISALPAEDIGALRRYAFLRSGVTGGERNKIKSAVMKLRRRAKRLDGFASAVGLVKEYYCVLGSE